MMNKKYKDFQFKQFSIQHKNAAMKIGTDGILLGAWADVSSALNVLDIGTGTGIISIMQVQKNNNLSIDALEIDASACIDAQYNFNQCPWSEKIKLHHLSLADFQPKKLYDSIISNPPFFDNSLTSKSTERNHARHSNSLHYNDIISFAADHLSNEGNLNMILPVEQGLSCTINAEKNGLFLVRRCNVFPNPNKKQHRLLLEFSKTRKHLNNSELTIEKDQRHQYTKEYKSLTRDFYIIFD